MDTISQVYNMGMTMQMIGMTMDTWGLAPSLQGFCCFITGSTLVNVWIYGGYNELVGWLYKPKLNDLVDMHIYGISMGGLQHFDSIVAGFMGNMGSNRESISTRFNQSTIRIGNCSLFTTHRICYLDVSFRCKI